MTTRDQYLSQKHRLLSQAESGYSTTTSSEDGFDVCKTPKQPRHHDFIITKPMGTLDLQDALKYDPLDIRGRNDRKRASGSVYSDMSSFDLDDSLSNFESPGVLHHYQPETLQVPTLVNTTQPAKQEAFRKSRHLSTDSGVAIGSDRSAFKPVKPRGRCYSSDATPPSIAPRLLDFVETAGSELRKNFARSESCQAPQPPRHQMTYTTDTMLNARVKHPHHELKRANPLRHIQAKHPPSESMAVAAPNTNSASMPPFQAASFDVTKLRCRIENSSGHDLKRLLRAGLESRNPTIVHTLNALIESKQEDTTKRKEEEPIPETSHCVRCHKGFDPNQRSRCNIPHPESMVLVVGQDDEGTDFICKCCKKGFRLFKMDFYEESTNSLFTGHCFSGQHTTDPRHVRYLNRGGAAQTCSDNGCVEFYV